ncbi:AraC family transcriptional regulator ligand-binding domain-containing protein [Simiduia curdlanivorans]|uniref:AraC family transcriptional regulator ligand-binding domain-containing protein n=1 Tax=Simiduia curdlanivorans TaxID=1492769 RepID=A0ABV8V8L9_9GAMM|nr:AraC family transcriptional regulator [Simiduia curdlanivorans]MDN3639411.1 AraC family transcriptional regulator ligand-binding domain-containing protein [Simiduia curdlanivorans]
MAQADVSVPSEYARTLLQTVAENGGNRDQLMAELGIAEAELTPGRGFSALKYGKLYQRVMRVMQDECFGMFSGGKVRLGSFRLLCLTVIQSTNLRQAIVRSGEFCEICRGFLVRSRLLEPAPGVARVEMCGISSVSPEAFAEMVNNATPNQVRTSLAVWQRFNSWLIGREIPLTGIYFAFSCPDEFREMAECYPAQLHFDQAFTGYEFDASFLDAPVVQNQNTLMDFVRSAPYHLVISDSSQQSLKAKVRAILSKDVSGSQPSAEDVASRLNLSVTTLRRKLQAEDTSYQRLKDECRMEAAFHYLSCPELTNSCIAERLGFDESSAFFRAFKKWTGVTPGDYRKGLDKP